MLSDDKVQSTALFSMVVERTFIYPGRVVGKTLDISVACRAEQI